MCLTYSAVISARSENVKFRWFVHKNQGQRDYPPHATTPSNSGARVSQVFHEQYDASGPDCLPAVLLSTFQQLAHSVNSSLRTLMAGSQRQLTVALGLFSLVSLVSAGDKTNLPRPADPFADPRHDPYNPLKYIASDVLTGIAFSGCSNLPSVDHFVDSRHNSSGYGGGADSDALG